MFPSWPCNPPRHGGAIADRPLDARVDEGLFRADLLARVSGFVLRLPGVALVVAEGKLVDVAHLPESVRGVEPAAPADPEAWHRPCF